MNSAPPCQADFETKSFPTMAGGRSPQTVCVQWRRLRSFSHKLTRLISWERTSEGPFPQVSTVIYPRESALVSASLMQTGGCNAPPLAARPATKSNDKSHILRTHQFDPQGTVVATGPKIAH